MATKSKTPKTMAELKKKHPKVYEEFLRQKSKTGITFAQFIKNLK